MPVRLVRNCAFAAVGGAVSLSALSLAASQAPSADEREETLARLGRYVEHYYSRARSVVAEETVMLQPLQSDMTMTGIPRRLVYELRVEWNPSVEGDESPATVTRRLLTVNGRPPRKDEKPECMDPRSVSPEPLAFLLPDRREKFAFTGAGLGRVDGRDALMVDYRSLHAGKPTVECRLWADPQSAAVVRIDEQLMGMVDLPIPRKHQRVNGALYMTLERANMSIRYRSVTFSDPDETLLLPAEIISSSMWRNGGSSLRHRRPDTPVTQPPMPNSQLPTTPNSQLPRTLILEVGVWEELEVGCWE